MKGIFNGKDKNIKVKLKKVKKIPAPIATEQDAKNFLMCTYSDKKMKNSKIVSKNLMNLRFLQI